MSDASDIVTRVRTHVETAIATVVVDENPISVDATPADGLPHAQLYITDYTVEPLDFGQERRVVTISAIVIRSGSTREAIHTDLEAIRAEVVADPDLNDLVDSARFETLLVTSNPDATRVYGEFAVVTETVA